MKIFFYLTLLLFSLNSCSVRKKTDPYGLEPATKKQSDISYELKRLSNDYETSIKNRNK